MQANRYKIEMECASFFLALPILAFFYVITINSGRWKSSNLSRLPPGPYPLPIIGNIFRLGENPHLSLASLSKTYGPLMSLKLGSIITIVVSSPQVAKEIFLKHDGLFSSRSVPDAGRWINHDLFSMVWLPVGDKWRMLRKISKEHLFSAQQLDSGKLLRRENIQKLLNFVHGCCLSGKSVNISQSASTTILNVLSNFIFSTDIAPYDSLESQEFKDAVSALAEFTGKPNLADFFPLLKPFDPQGLLKKGNIYAEKVMVMLDRKVDRHVQVRAKSLAGAFSTSHDVLDVLLDLSQKNESEFSRNDILHLLFDFFGAATDTTASTLEWAMTELLHNPEKMAKALSELVKITGQNNGIIEESDIPKLPYLNAVIKETFRLHPVVPFLVPHKALCDVEIQGFIVPKDAQILCNVLAIGRDPSIWSEPQVFMPERFLDINIDYKGRDFELLPFGSGRRICPGLPLAHGMLHLMLGSLIYQFDWELEGGKRIEEMDMCERFGIVLHKKVPLMAIPIKI